MANFAIGLFALLLTALAAFLFALAVGMLQSADCREGVDLMCDPPSSRGLGYVFAMLAFVSGAGAFTLWWQLVANMQRPRKP
jgi:hypothetical protein